MDFRKVLAAFLAVFVALDIFLGIQWVREYPFSDNRPTDEQILDEMSDDGIVYKNLSQNHQIGSYLAGKSGKQMLMKHVQQLRPRWQTSFSNNQLKVVAQTPIALGMDTVSDVQALNQLIKKRDQVIAGTHYQYSKKMTQIVQSENKQAANVYVYVQKIPTDRHQFLADRAQIVFEVDHHHRLKSYSQQYVNQTQFLRDDMQLISEKQALISLYQYNELPNNSTVKLSMMGYTTLTTVKNDIIFVPVWQFLIENSSKTTEVVSVNAINGSIMK